MSPLRKSAFLRSIAGCAPQAYHKRRFPCASIYTITQAELDASAAVAEADERKLGFNRLVSLAGRLKEHLAHEQPIIARPVSGGKIKPLAFTAALQRARRGLQIHEGALGWKGRPHKKAEFGSSLATLIESGVRIPERAGLNRHGPFVAAKKSLLQAKRGLSAPSVLAIVILLYPRRSDERRLLAERHFPIGGGLKERNLVALAEDVAPNLLTAFRRNPSARRSGRRRERGEDT